MGPEGRQVARELQVLAMIEVEHVGQDAVVPSESADQLVEVTQHGFAPLRLEACVLTEQVPCPGAGAVAIAAVERAMDAVG